MCVPQVLEVALTVLVCNLVLILPALFPFHFGTCFKLEQVGFNTRMFPS